MLSIAGIQFFNEESVTREFQIADLRFKILGPVYDAQDQYRYWPLRKSEILNLKSSITRLLHRLQYFQLAFCE